MNSPTHQNILNSINISATSNKIAKIENDLKIWYIPKEHFKKVYKYNILILLEIKILCLQSLHFLLIKILRLLNY